MNTQEDCLLDKQLPRKVWHFVFVSALTKNKCESEVTVILHSVVPVVFAERDFYMHSAVFFVKTAAHCNEL